MRWWAAVTTVLGVLSVAGSAFAAESSTVYTRQKGIQLQYQQDSSSSAQETAVARMHEPRPFPVYISELSDLHAYSAFANGGWDGNWYVGFNVCWMEELPPPPSGDYRKAYVGAKLGRMKTRPVPGRPIWEKEPIPGSIYIAISSTPAWQTAQSFALVDADDIPLEGSQENTLEGVGESRWFWAEVPVNAVNFSGPNYIALWSPSEYYVSTTSSPILAAGAAGDKKINAWLNNDVRGYLPLNPSTALKTPITGYAPAIALRMIPLNTEQKIRVSIQEIKASSVGSADQSFVTYVDGDHIEKAWMETWIPAQPEWKRKGRCVYDPPYTFTMKAAKLPAGVVRVRFAASDIWGNVGYSKPLNLSVEKQISKTEE